jgi:hypothetical protein
MTEREREQPAGDAAAHAAVTPGEPVDPVGEEEEEATAIGEAASDAASHEVHADHLVEEAEPVPVHDEEFEEDAIGEAASDAAAHDLHSSLNADRLPRGDEVEDGEIARKLEDLLPLTWFAILAAVCYIGIYYAVDSIPGRTNPLPGPNWFGL